jgi:hypothetical protein
VNILPLFTWTFFLLLLLYNPEYEKQLIWKYS